VLIAYKQLMGIMYFTKYRNYVSVIGYFILNIFSIISKGCGIFSFRNLIGIQIFYFSNLTFLKTIFIFYNVLNLKIKKYL